jgi:DNA-binding transcriptional ArsR family regulator
MPLQGELSYDVLTPMMRLESSAVFEMLVSLESVLDSFWHPQWTETVRRKLGDSFIDELSALYSEFHEGSMLSELGVDAPDLNDIPGFMNHVDNMDERRLVFFLLGRLYPEEDIPRPCTKKAVLELVSRPPDDVCTEIVGATFDWADNPLAFRDRLVALWRRYWNELFSDHAAETVECAHASIREKQTVLQELGGTVLYEQITGNRELPDELPPGNPFREIRAIPVLRINRRRKIYFGYGQITILFDCARTEQRENDIASAKTRAVETMRALADETRISILKFLGQHENSANGRMIAQSLGLSASVVSRHLRQMKDAGLVEENSPDNRNITYRLLFDRLYEIPAALARYIKD